MGLKKILLVDDSQPFNFLTRMVLKQNGIDCQVDEALTGKSALDYVIKGDDCPDVILLDINMPVMDGFEFLDEFGKKLKCRDKTKVFMLTSSTREEDKEMAFKSPAVKGYFDKPLNKEHVKIILAALQN